MIAANNPLKFMKAVILLLAALSIALICTNAFAQTKPLHTGWYKVKWLKKHGYGVPAGASGSIYIRRTNDQSKVNIILNQ